MLNGSPLMQLWFGWADAVLLICICIQIMMINVQCVPLRTNNNNRVIARNRHAKFILHLMRDRWLDTYSIRWRRRRRGNLQRFIIIG